MIWHQRSARYAQAPFGGLAITLDVVERSRRGQPVRMEFRRKRCSRNEADDGNFLAHVESLLCTRGSVRRTSAFAVVGIEGRVVKPEEGLRLNIPEASASCFAAVPRRYRYVFQEHARSFLVCRRCQYQMGRRHPVNGNHKIVRIRNISIAIR